MPLCMCKLTFLFIRVSHLSKGWCEYFLSLSPAEAEGKRCSIAKLFLLVVCYNCSHFHTGMLVPDGESIGWPMTSSCFLQKPGSATFIPCGGLGWIAASRPFQRTLLLFLARFDGLIEYFPQFNNQL